MHFWKGFGMLMEGTIYTCVQQMVCYSHPIYSEKVTEAIRELQAIMENRDVTLCCALALLHAQKKLPMPDKDIIAQLEVVFCTMNSSEFVYIFLVFHYMEHLHVCGATVNLKLSRIV